MTPDPQAAECRTPAPSLDECAPMLSAAWALSELARLSSHRVNLQQQLEAVHVERWSR